MAKLDAFRLREVLDYDPETGFLTWRVTLSNRGKAGSRAGVQSPIGYIRVGIDGRSYDAHRLAFLHVTGQWPAAHMDHIDHDKSNNKWSNLREATPLQNQWNRRGVGIQQRPTGLWMARIRHEGKHRYLGTFATADEAHAAYRAAALRWRGEFTYAGPI